MTPTPDQPRPDAAEMTTARTVVAGALDDLLYGFDDDEVGAEADRILSALAEQGLVVVNVDDLDAAIDAVYRSAGTSGPIAKREHMALLKRLNAALAARQGVDTDGN